MGADECDLRGFGAGIFAQLKQVALDGYDRTVGLVLEEIAIDGRVTKAPGGGERAGLGPQPGDIRIHLDTGYDSQATRRFGQSRSVPPANAGQLSAGAWPAA